MPQYNDYKVSQDGKTVTVNGKKYTRSQFLKTFKAETTGGKAKYGVDAVTPGAKGIAQPLPKSTKVTGTTLAEEKKYKATEKKAAAAKAAGNTKPTVGKTVIGNLAGRGGGGGMFGIKNR